MTKPIRQRDVLAGVRKPMPPRGRIQPSAKTKARRQRVKRVDLRQVDP